MKCEITLDANARSDYKTMRAAECAFNLRSGYYRTTYPGANWRRAKPLRIRCSAEQLVAFQVARDKLGGQNLWKALNVEILDPKPCCSGEIFIDATSGC